MKKLFLFAVCMLLMPSIAASQPSDIDTCYSADNCENGLSAMNESILPIDLYTQLEGIGIDGGFLFDTKTPQPQQIQCVKKCAVSVKKSHEECVLGVYSATTFGEGGRNGIESILLNACAERTKKKFQECRIQNDCALF